MMEMKMVSYTVKPLILSVATAEMSFQTYLAYIGEKKVRAYVMWYIEGGKKKILVDTAIEAQQYRDYSPLFKNYEFEHIQTFEQALESVNCRPEKIDIVIQTHLHFDHCMNTAKCINAEVYVQKDELAFALHPHPIFSSLYRKGLFKELNLKVVNGDTNLINGIDLLHVPGHSPGCQGVLVRTLRGMVAISGFCSISENFLLPDGVQTEISPFATPAGIIPGIHTNPFKAYDSLLKIKSSADVVIPLHDYEMAKKQEIYAPLKGNDL